MFRGAEFSLERRLAALLILILVSVSGCHSRKSIGSYSIRFTRVPQATLADPDTLDIIQGRVENAHPGQQVVLYVKTGAWWVQPLSNATFSKIDANGGWVNSTHLGSEYAALLVEPGYRPQSPIDILPTVGNQIAAITVSKGDTSSSPVSPQVRFSGYDWRVRTAPSSRGDRPNPYSAANAWTDAEGALHLRIAQESGKWTCAEVTLTSSLGYGLYSFAVRDTANLPANTVFSMFTWDYSGVDQNNREMEIEVSRTNDPAVKNAQFVIQPFYVAANVARFAAPAGKLKHSFLWEPGKVSFRTIRDSVSETNPDVLSEHIFTSGVPSPGVACVRMALYINGQAENPSPSGAEVVIEKFEYRP